MNLVEAIGAAGVVGCGGAGYPAQGKLKGSFEYFIINGAECEPLLRTDRYLMLNKAREIVQAAATIKHEMNIPHCFIALKEHYADEVRALEAAITALAVKEGFVPPTINYEKPDLEIDATKGEVPLDLNYTPNVGVKRDIRVALSSSLGFGGHNSILVFKKAISC